MEAGGARGGTAPADRVRRTRELVAFSVLWRPGGDLIWGSTRRHVGDDRCRRLAMGRWLRVMLAM